VKDKTKKGKGEKKEGKGESASPHICRGGKKKDAILFSKKFLLKTESRVHVKEKKKKERGTDHSPRTFC